MDLNQTIAELRAQRDKLESVINELVHLKDGIGKMGSKRGRKFMGEAERREVSARMKSYWASRRKAQGSAE
jgi:hypothetical protein